MTVGTSGITCVIKIYIVPIVGEVAVGALAGPVPTGWSMASFAIGIAGVVKNNIVPTGTGNVACGAITGVMRAR